MPERSHRYAGFPARLAAYLLDEVIVLLAAGVSAIPFLGVGLLLKTLDGPERDALSGMLSVAALVSLLPFLLFGQWLYHAAFESSAWQATPGKRLLGLRVLDEEGRPLAFGRASARYVARWASGLLFNLGYVMAAFTARKQALHDLIAGTIVVRDS